MEKHWSKDSSETVGFFHDEHFEGYLAYFSMSPIPLLMNMDVTTSFVHQTVLCTFEGRVELELVEGKDRWHKLVMSSKITGAQQSLETEANWLEA